MHRGDGKNMQLPGSNEREVAARNLQRSNADAVVSRVYRGLKESLVPLARENVMAHLLKLEREGRARVDEDVWTMIGP